MEGSVLGGGLVPLTAFFFFFSLMPCFPAEIIDDFRAGLSCTKQTSVMVSGTTCSFVFNEALYVFSVKFPCTGRRLVALSTFTWSK